jgi:hypothetical protein
MKLFEGKTPAERNKIIVALVVGTLALLAILNLIFQPFSSRKTNVTVKTSPTATPTVSNKSDTVVTNLPPQQQIDSEYASIPVVYPLVGYDAPAPGRNIFAFYEPPKPTPYSPTPTPSEKPIVIKTPTPPPPAPQTISYVQPQSVFAGSSGFRLEVNGLGFTPETRIIFNGQEVPTNFVNEQKVTAEIPSNFISGAGNAQIFVRTPDGKLFSYPVFLNVQAAPRPQFQYVGIVAPKQGNNLTAYIKEGSNQPIPKRLGDKIGNCGSTSVGCFSVVSIAREKMIVQDLGLGFRYTIEIIKESTQTTTGGRTNPNFPITPDPNSQVCPPNCPGIQPYNPNNSNPRPNQNPNNPKQDVDDNDDEDGDN